MNHRRELRRVALCGLCIALTFLSACSPKAPAPEPVRAVRTQPISAESVAGAFEFAGDVRARTESRLAFRVPGQLLSRRVGLGDAVKPGQVLAQLDPADLRLAQEGARAALEAARVQAEQLTDEFKRFSGLRERGFISGAEYDRRLAAYQAARAQLAQAQASADAQSNQTRYAVLSSDLAGVVTSVDADPGTVLAAGTPVLRVAHDGPRDVVFQVPEHIAAQMRSLVGKAAALQVQPWAKGGGAAESGWLKATVREVAQAADPLTRTFTVKADVGQARLLLGQTMTVRLPLPASALSLVLPTAAVAERQGRPVVWVLDPSSMTVQPVVVEVQAGEGQHWVVKSGLQAGQEVVTAGVHTLTPGQKVQRYVDPRGAAAVLSR